MLALIACWADDHLRRGCCWFARGIACVDTPVALAAAALLVCYGLLGLTARRQLRRNGQKIAEASTQQIKVLQEGLGAIRDVVLVEANLFISNAMI